MGATKIEWADETWSPATGCTPVSEGCENCYARRMAQRLKGRFGYPADDPFRVTIHEDKLDAPLKWRKPRMVFVCSMGDLFHEDVPRGIIKAVYGVTIDCPQHVFQILTKRPERMREFSKDLSGWAPNVWLGVTAENQQRWDERVPILLDTPAVVRFVSCEPLLGKINVCFDEGMWGVNPLSGLRENPYTATVTRKLGPHIHWLIVGGETGPGARHMDPKWAMALRDQAVKAGIPFLFKKMGDYWDKAPVEIPLPTNLHDKRLLDGCEWNEFPEVSKE